MRVVYLGGGERGDEDDGRSLWWWSRRLVMVSESAARLLVGGSNLDKNVSQTHEEDRDFINEADDAEEPQ